MYAQAVLDSIYKQIHKIHRRETPRDTGFVHTLIPFNARCFSVLPTEGDGKTDAGIVYVGMDVRLFAITLQQWKNKRRKISTAH